MSYSCNPPPLFHLLCVRRSLPSQRNIAINVRRSFGQPSKPGLSTLCGLLAVNLRLLLEYIFLKCFFWTVDELCNLCRDAAERELYNLTAHGSTRLRNQCSQRLQTVWVPRKGWRDVTAFDLLPSLVAKRYLHVQRSVFLWCIAYRWCPAPRLEGTRDGFG